MHFKGAPLDYRNIQRLRVIMYRRCLALPEKPKESFFLWGGRKNGKSTLLSDTYKDAHFIDLLDSDSFLKYAQRPQILREELDALPAASGNGGQLIVIDEIQKVPGLLDEVHWNIERRKRVFGLCGSSARKLRRGHANLLGGRALRYELGPFVAKELGSDFSLDRALNVGLIPQHYLSTESKGLLRAYISDYLREEIAAESLVRNLPAFGSFLEVAALSDTESVSFSSIARDCGVSAPTVREYFQVLIDTLIATLLPPFSKRPKRRTVQASKFYFNDVGLAGTLAKRGQVIAGSEAFGKAFENWIHHEIRCYLLYSSSDSDLSWWKTSSGTEVDFIIDQPLVAIEAKSSKKITSDHLKGLRTFADEYPEVTRRVVVCCEERPRVTEDRILILPWQHFLDQLWAGELC